MLISFNVKNFRSIKDDIEFSMVASALKEDAPSVVFENEYYETTLSASVMYGPNAAGKTSVIRALSAVQQLISESLKDNSALLEVITPFLFDPKTTSEPSEFDVIFISNGIRYQYGFSATKERIMSEWLYSFPKGRSNKLFVRQFNEKTQYKYDYSYGRSFVGEQKGTEKITAENSLFLSASQRTRAIETTKDVLSWFIDKLIIIGVKSVTQFGTAGLIADEELNKSEVIRFLQDSGIEVADINVKKLPFSESLLPQNMPDGVKQDILQKLKDEIILEVDMHHSANGRDYVIPISEESSGTQKLFKYSAAILTALKNGAVLVVDELNNNLHPKLVEAILKIFSNKEININQSQLFFTTHDATILSLGLLRRDQVWFCERDQFLATQIRSLAEYKIRPLDNYENAYLSGKFNAIPLMMTELINNYISKAN